MESELNRCRDKLDFHKYVIAVLCIAIVLLSAMLYFCKSAHAGYVVASMGVSKANLNSEGGTQNPAWTQPYFGWEYTSDFRSNVWNIGAGFDINSRFSVETRYNKLGRFNVFGSWGCDDSGSHCGKTTYGYGSASAESISLSVRAKAFSIGDASLVFEFGAHHWKSPWYTHYSNSADPYAKTLNRYEPVKPKGTSGLYGVGVDYKQFRFSLTRYHIEPRDGSFSRIDTMTVGYRF